MRVYLDEQLKGKLKNSGKVLVLYPTLKFSCLIAKRFEAKVEDRPPEGILLDVDGVRVCVVFKVIGSKFCGNGFEEFEFPVKEPERFYPKWIRVNEDLSGEFGYF